MRVLAAQGMPVGHVVAPVEHLLPVGSVEPRRRLDKQPRVARLAVALGGDVPLLHRRGQLEEPGQQLVSGVEHLGGMSWVV